MLNCLNCGAPFEADKEKCSYCDTSYYDMSALDINSGKPFMLKIKTMIGNQECCITQLVRALPNMSMELNTETTDCVDVFGHTVCSFTSRQSLSTNITFQAVQRKNGSLCTVVIEK